MISTQPNRRSYRPEVIIVLIMTAGFLFTFFAPLWLKPPYFEYTIFIYIVVCFAWTPVFAFVAWRKYSTYFSSVLMVVGLCLTILIFTALASYYPFSFPTRNIRCNEYVSEGRTNYNCFFLDEQGPCLESGINYEFEGIGDLPLMRFNYAWTGGMCTLF